MPTGIWCWALAGGVIGVAAFLLLTQAPENPNQTPAVSAANSPNATPAQPVILEGGQVSQMPAEPTDKKVPPPHVVHTSPPPL